MISRGKKNKRGRPKKILPAEYWADLRNLRVSAGLRGKEIKVVMDCGGKRVEFVDGVRGLLDTCRRIIAKYGDVRWVDEQDRVVDKITVVGTLRNKIMQAQRRGLKEHEVRQAAWKNAKIVYTGTTGATHRNAGDAIMSVSIARSAIVVTGKTGAQRRTVLMAGNRILHNK